jgi:hypothetical protein
VKIRKTEPRLVSAERATPEPPAGGHPYQGEDKESGGWRAGLSVDSRSDS